MISPHRLKNNSHTARSTYGIFTAFKQKTLPAPVIALVLSVCCCANARHVRAAGNRWIPDRIRVDSIGSQYDINAPVSDGYREPLYWRDSWASNERNVAPRWVGFFFDQPVPVEAIAIHWAVEDGHPKASGKHTTSRAYRIQAWQDNDYHDLVNVADALPAPRSLHVFDRVKTDRIRVWQPAGGGPAFRTNVMWITEIEVYDYPKSEEDFGTETDAREVRQARETMRNRTIGFFRRCPSTGHSHNRRSAAMARPLLELARAQGWRTMGLDRLDERELQRCRIVVIAGNRHIPNRHKLLAFLHNGGSVLFVHNACGRGGGGSLLPELWEFKGMGEGELVTIDQDHPVTLNLPDGFIPTWGEHARLRAGRRGVALVRDHEGYDVVVAGEAGRGRAVAIGNFPGLSSAGTAWSEYMPRPPEGAELALLTNSIAWLTHAKGMRDMGHETRALRRDLRRLRERYQPFFKDVTEECGLPYYGFAKGVAMADINHNGRLDIFATVNTIPTADPYHNLLIRNDGNWRFTEISAAAGVTGPPGIGTVFGDVTGDGNLDLWVSWLPEMEYPVDARGVLYLGDGRGGFRDATDGSGLEDTGMTAVCMLADVNNNGHLDLYLVGYRSNNKLYINRGDGTFEDRTDAYGLGGLGSEGAGGYGSGLAAAVADLDHSGFVDLVVLSHGKLRIFRNMRGEKFEEVTDYMGPGEPLAEAGSLGLALGDINNNGLLDIYNSGANILLRNEGQMRFTDITADAGLDKRERYISPYGAKFVDLDNSGWLDLFQATGVYDSFVFRNNGDGSFTDVTATLGLDVHAVHGFNFGDLDGNGALDFYATAWSKHPFKLLRNTIENNNSLTIRVKGRQSNTSGIGAKIWVYDESEQDAQRRLRGYREVRSGGGSMYSGATLQQHVGLGAGDGAYTVETLFPVSGARVTVSNVVPRTVLVIEEPAKP